MGAWRMNITFYYESLDLGGQQTQTYQLIKRLAQRGHCISWVYVYGGNLKSYVETHAQVVQITPRLRPGEYRRRPWRLLIQAWRLAQCLRTSHADVVVSGSGIGSFVAGLAAKAVGARHFRLVGCSLAQVERTLYKFYRWCGIDKLIDGYFGWPPVFRELAARGVRPSKFIELKSAVDTELFAPEDKTQVMEFRRSLGIADDELVIGWIGRLSPDMQCGNTLEVCSRLRDAGLQKFKFLVVGSGVGKDWFEKLITQKGLQDCTVLTGWVPMKMVPHYVNAMDIVPLLELDPHGGSIVREAMACGRVALSVDGISGAQRLFMPEECAVLVPSDGFIEAATAEILRLASDSRELEAMGSRARQYAQVHMSFESQVESMLYAMIPGREDVICH
ncbi:MAG: hypothetical protein B7X83_00130 [Polynucleobacter sp. 17-46-58]|jgi:glycosyltransferase involved in cell wall biosynthesis|nr:MAG: hypothetical protein B7X83_00130 [Polynucleobacter sp. 17-46-58]OZB49689.1 MAG: hypothetical protein B7X60_00215 [Polynucleobacter sp. 39-45-136]